MGMRLSFKEEDRRDSKLVDFDVNSAIMELKNQVDFEADDITMHKMIDSTLQKYS